MPRCNINEFRHVPVLAYFGMEAQLDTRFKFLYITIWVFPAGLPQPDNASAFTFSQHFVQCLRTRSWFLATFHFWLV